MRMLATRWSLSMQAQMPDICRSYPALDRIVWGYRAKLLVQILPKYQNLRHILPCTVKLELSSTN